MHQIREATPSDNDALLELERNSPLDLGDRILCFRSRAQLLRPPGDAGARARARRGGGRAAGGRRRGAWHDVLIGGKRRRLLYIHQGRVLPEYRRRHVGTDLVVQQMALAAECQVRRALLADQPRQRHVAGVQSTGGSRELAHRRANGRLRRCRSKGRGTRSGQRRSGRLAASRELINRTHAGREMFLPYDVDSLPDDGSA